MATVRERILARPDLMAMREARNLDGLAAALNAEERRESGERYVTLRTILAECTNGRSIVGALRQAAVSDAIVEESLNFLRSDSGFDVGHPETAVDIDRLVTAGVLTQAWADQMKALALRPVVVTRGQVEAAMFNPDGTEK